MNNEKHKQYFIKHNDKTFGTLEISYAAHKNLIQAIANAMRARFYRVDEITYYIDENENNCFKVKIGNRIYIVHDNVGPY